MSSEFIVIIAFIIVFLLVVGATYTYTQFEKEYDSKKLDE
tara:strand:- start:1337 stop:1456 length:120 start_codon:yes stop_codon:yes gene_type:complete